MGQAGASSRPRAPLRKFYRSLLRHFGPQHWWPAETPFEVIIGAILTQSTAWTNVEKAIANLRRAGALSIPAMEVMSEAELAELVRPSGYYRQKAKKLKAFLEYLRERHGGSLRRMFAVETVALRRDLLSIHGIGPETADSILLYAGRHPVFVVDAYTRRILERHELMPSTASYVDIQRLLEREIPPDPAVYNEFHALLVAAGKEHCLRAAPQCAGCPLDRFPHRATELRVKSQLEPQMNTDKHR